MSDGKEIKFNYGNASASFKNNTFSYQNDAGNKLRKGLQNIFNAIKKEEGDQSKIDTQKEVSLLNKLQSIFAADGDSALSEDDMAWAKTFKAGGDVVDFIETKYNEVMGGEPAEDPAVVTPEEPAVVTPEESEVITGPNTPFVLSKSRDLEAEGYVGGEWESLDGFEGVDVLHKEGLPDIYSPTDIIEDRDDNYWMGCITDTPEKVQTYVQQVKAELGKIQPEQEDETDEAAAARKAQNMHSVEKIAELANYNKDVMLQLIKDYLKQDEYVDTKSPEYNNFVQRLLGTKDADVIKALGLLTDNRYRDIDDDTFRGDETTYKSLVSLYKEVRGKERRGEVLNDNDKAIKAYFQEYEVDCGYRYNDDLRITYDGNGNICYQGKPYDFDHGTATYDDGYGGGAHIHVIAGKSKELVEGFQNDYRAAVRAIENAPVGEKENVMAAEFKALFKKYAGNTDDSFACSVLTSHLLEYADPEDIQKAINANGAEYLMYLGTALSIDGNYSLDDEQKNEIRKAIADRAVEIYTHSERCVVSNMRFIDGVLDSINNTKFSDDGDENIRIKDEKMHQILNSYFVVTTDEAGNETYQYAGRRMTYEEAKVFCSLLGADGQTFGGVGYQRSKAIMAAMTADDVRNGEWGIAAGEVMEPLYLVDRYSESVDGMNKEEMLDFLSRIPKNDAWGDIAPYDKILEKWGDDRDVREVLFSRLTPTSNGISMENRISLIKDYMVDNGDGTYTAQDVSFDDLSKALPRNTVDITTLYEELDGNKNAQELVKIWYAAFELAKFDDKQESWIKLYNSLGSEGKDIFHDIFFEKLMREENLNAKNVDKAMKILKNLGIDKESDQVKALMQTTAETALTRLATDPTGDKIHDVVLLINTLDVDKAALGKFAEKIVDAAVQKLQDEPDAYMLTQLIEFCYTCDTDVDTIVNDLNISGHNKDKARELQHVMYLKFVKNRAKKDGLSENLVNALIKNGWMTTGELSSYNKDRTVTRSGNIYAMGYYEFEIGSDGKIHQRSSKGTQAGLDIFDSVRGLNARYGAKHNKAIETIDKIDMDSVVDTILTFNAASKKYNGSLYGQDRIMKYLNNEHGITVETMLNIPQALVQWGKENGKDTAELEGLIAKAGDKAEKNFPKGLADQLDDAMLRLINS